MDRREFLQVLGLVSGATLLSSCGSDKGQKELISLLVPAEEGRLPGVATWRPSTCTECPAHCGILVRLREDRPVKVEGIPEHPVNRGGLCVRGQASLWRLYHPERFKSPLLRNSQGKLEPITWSQALSRIASALREGREQGRRNFFLSGRTTGTLSRLIDETCQGPLLERLPEFEAFSHTALSQSYQKLFNQADIPRYRIDQADLLLSIGADLLETFVSPVDYAEQITRGRQQNNLQWVHVEPHISLTGVNATSRLTLHPGTEPYLLSWLLQKVSTSDRYRKSWPAALNDLLPEHDDAGTAAVTGLSTSQLDALAKSFLSARKPLLIVGGLATAHEGSSSAALLAALIQGLTAVPWGGIDFSAASNYASVGNLLDLARLSSTLEAKEVGVLLISRCNPVFHAPPSMALPKNMTKAKFRVGLADLPDETTQFMDLILPLSHSLETWGDTEPRRNIRSLLQPMIKLQYDTLGEGDILLQLRQQLKEPGIAEEWHSYLTDHWRKNFSQAQLRQLLEKGYLESRSEETSLRLDSSRIADALRDLHFPAPLPKPVAVIAPSIRTYDGRSRPLALLNEIPDPLTTISYGSWVSVPSATAHRHGLKDSQVLQLGGSPGQISRPIKIQPGLPPDILVLSIDSLPSPAIGIDPVSGEAVRYLSGLRLKATNALQPLPILSGSLSQQGRGIIPKPVHREEEHHHKRLSLYPEPAYDEYRWTMVIDLEKCIGCSGCVAACYIENNVPVVGAKDHLAGREMSWLRIEPFYDKSGQVEFIPMLCQHCAFAPCEPVCPVYAAYHNPEGLNVQVYNRCVGTRYCSNNCPYKVRRFNWWQHEWPAPLDKLRNPDVTQRSKGMMEKCTFCIQRLRDARDLAKDEGRLVQDGEVTTACAQSCPARAIVFGNRLDANSRINQLLQDDRAYRVFNELGTEPSIYYLRPKRS